MQDSKSHDKIQWDMENRKVEFEHSKNQTADLLENAGRMLRNADRSTQIEDIRNLILEIESAIRTFKETSGITFEPLDNSFHKKPELPANHPLKFKRLGESSAHKSSGYPKKSPHVVTNHHVEDGKK